MSVPKKDGVKWWWRDAMRLSTVIISSVSCMRDVYAPGGLCLPMCSVPSLAGIPFPGIKAEIKAQAELIEMDTWTYHVCDFPLEMLSVSG